MFSRKKRRTLSDKVGDIAVSAAITGIAAMGTVMGIVLLVLIVLLVVIALVLIISFA
ncbi:hypothetical protein SDC9_203774 [bioreactor metagenome]|uniref:Uncharacterized protein n=1 Tax=bioreactor metagenome TaxID=1076179 RepID=A0A645IXE9_9ZZZZ